MIQVNNSPGPTAAKQKPPPIDVPDEKLNPVSMLNDKWDKIAMNMIGNPQPYREKIIIPHSLGGGCITTNEKKKMSNGFALGAGIDLFSITVIPNVVPIKKPYRFTKVLRDLNITTFSTAKSFALIGAVFSAAEFTIEFYQEKTDYKNDTYAAALTGGMLGRRAGKMGFVRAFGFAAFYAYTSHIYYYMEKTKAIMVT
uniref:Mitochondrial import inner membrane translocase subunit TIM22 n=1 Tax=Trichogramma kaykai TaxID=54128 RepID=A0ABD2XFH1_9HYME